MANQQAAQDGNQQFALIAHSGTAGTAETVRVVADSAGNIGVNVVSGEIIASLGTVDVVKAGSVVVTAGTVSTLNTIGTVGVLNAGSVVMTAGTISTLNTVGTIGVVNAGSVVVTAGTVSQGTINVKYIDTGGTTHGFIDNAGAPQICSQPYQEALAEGDISGHSTWSKIGFTPTMTTTESDVWSKAGVYNFVPGTVGTAMQVSSSDNTGDNVGGTGALSVTVVYLDRNYTAGTETINLTGTAAATTVATDIFRVNSFRVTSAGSYGKAVGTITMTDAGGTSIYGHITAGFTRARNSTYTVPAGKNLYITYANISYGYAANQTHYARIYLRATQNDGVKTAGIYHPLAEVISANSASPVNFSMPIKVVEKVDLKVSGTATAAGIASVVLRGWLE